MNQIAFLHSSSMQDLANAVQEEFKGSSYVEIIWNSFPDGWSDIFIKDADSLRMKDVVFFLELNSPSRVFQQIALLSAIPRYQPRTLLIILPYFPTGTMERIDEYGQIATAMSLWHMLSEVPMCRSGVPTLITYDIHTLSQQFYADHHRLSVVLQSAIPLFKRYLKEYYIKDMDISDEEQLMIAFPDNGAFKRFKHYFHGFDKIICDKIRLNGETKIVIREGDPRNRHVIMVDDLVYSGATLLNAGKIIHNLGASSVSAFVTHGVFPQESWKKFEKEWKYGKVICTDSCSQHKDQLNENSVFHILSLKDQIVSDIDNYIYS